MSASSAKRCLYEVLGGLNRECTPDEIRSAYRKLALQRHPDKLVKSGISEAEATAQFQELVNAYEVLSDPRERAWYDSHRSQILFSDNINNKSSASGSSSGLPDLFSFFSNSVYNGYGDTGKGFFKVYGQVFDDIYRNEVNFAKKLGLAYPNEAPLLGNLDSPYVQVTAFFNYWLGFITIMDFCWVDQYDAMAGMNRKSRRMMEDENKKLRKKARRDYNDTVRGLAEFVKKRDKRVIDMQVKRKEEMEKKKEEEKKRKKELEKQKAERAMQYEEPEWAKIDEEEEEFEELVEDEDDEKKNELYCVVCGKKFKSDKQWKNHEQSKKHKEKVVELRRAFKKEDKANFEEFEEDGNGYLSEDNVVDEVINEFEDHKINDNTTQSESNQKDEDEDNDEDEEEEEEDNDEDEEEEEDEDEDEASMLEAMMKMKKNLNSKKPKASVQEVKVNDDDDEMEFMEYNNVKETRRNKNRRRKGKKLDVNEEDVPVNVSKTDEHEDENAEQNNTHEDVLNVEESPSDSQIENEIESDEKKEKLLKQTVEKVDKKVASKKENINQKNAKKGKKQKATSTKGNARLQKESSNECEKCGEEFESRNKLHRHLEDTGHAKLKHR